MTAQSNSAPETQTTRDFSSIMVTGGAGFIGSNFIRHVITNTNFRGTIVNLDKLTYAGNLHNLDDISESESDSRYYFERADICDYDRTLEICSKYATDLIVHFAAESHVDRSIKDPESFIRTNINGTCTLLEVVKGIAEKGRSVHFHHVSTDEVYGSLGDEGQFFENTPYDPKSPYSASKASSDHMVRAYSHTYGLSATLSNCSNNYGPYQFPEKLIPLMILNMLEKRPLPIYGTGSNVRDWLYVTDHASAVWTVATKGLVGETYNIGAENEWRNLDLVEKLCTVFAEETGESESSVRSLIRFVADRPGHDRRYSVNSDKIRHGLGWQSETSFEKGLKQTVRWYLGNPKWVQAVRSGEYRSWIEEQYR